MTWQSKIFAYCERGTDPGFWAEPVNALTNLAFLLAAAAALTRWSRGPQRDHQRIELVMILMVGAIGIGSFLFHTYAERWAALADIIPITIFMVTYLAYALRRFLALAVLWVGLAILVFFLSLPMAALIVRGAGGSFFAGTASYLPALAAMALVGITLLFCRHPAAAKINTATCLFAVSLTLRSLDRAWCGWAPERISIALGTHFAWHLLNALLLYILLRPPLSMARISHHNRHYTKMVPAHGWTKFNHPPLRFPTSSPIKTPHISKLRTWWNR